MLEVPTIWSECSIDDYATFIKEKGEINQTPYLEIGDVSINNKEYLLKDKPSVKGCRKAEKDDVLVSRVRPNRGAICIINEESIKVSSAFTVLRQFFRTNKKYLFYQLAWNEKFLSYLGNNCTGTMYPTVAEEIIKKFLIVIAPLNEQKRIVKKLDKLLTKVDEAQNRLVKIPGILKRFRQSVLNAAVTGELTKDWRERNPNVQSAETLLEILLNKRRKINNKLKLNLLPIEESNELPDNWILSRLVNIADIKGGVTKGRKFKGKKTIMLPYLRVANVQDGFLDINEIKNIEVLPEDLNKYRLLHGDILFTEGGDRDKLGRGTIWREEINNCIHQNHIFRARVLKEYLVPEYVSFFTKSETAKTYFYKNASQTVNLASINLTTLGGVSIALPPFEEQKEIVKRVEALFKFANEIEERYKKAQAYVDKLTPSILAKAFRGELVPQDPNDEPAEKLLERIREEREKMELTKKRKGRKGK